MDTDESIVLSFNSLPAFQTAEEVIYGKLRPFARDYDLGYGDKLVTCFDSVSYTQLRHELHLLGIEENAEFTVFS